MTSRCVEWAATAALVVAMAAPLGAGEARTPPPAAPNPAAKAAAGKNKKPKTPPRPPEPVHVWADRIHYIQEKNHARITGNATVIKGDMRIDADLILADLDEKTSQFKKMTATGNVRVYTVAPVVQRTATRPPLRLAPDARTATCDKAIYDSATGTIYLYGSEGKPPVVHFGKDEVRADVIIYHRDKQLLEFQGNVQLTALLGGKATGSKPPPPKGEPPKKAPRAK